MSTNKTENYQLHAWEAGDDFLRSEINENFAAIDGILPENKRLRVVTGTYQGTGWQATQTVPLPFAPKALLAKCGIQNHLYYVFLALPGQEGALQLDGDSLTVTYLMNLSPTDSLVNPPAQGKLANPYSYIALGWEE